MTTKQITFNLSSLSSSHKSKKHREIKHKPIISPNVLKNKLLKRIKEHKKKEQKENDNTNSKSDSENTDILAYTDEFNDSIDYLQNLSKLNQIEQKREQLYRQTLKHNNTSPVLQVFNDLPDELKPPSNIPLPFNNSPTIQLNNHDTIPYGVLKNGNKPTFREWQKTQKNLSPSLQPTNQLSEREKKLADLKEKLRKQSISLNTPSTKLLHNPSTMSPSTVTPILTNMTPNNVMPHPINPSQITTSPSLTTSFMQSEIAIPSSLATSYETVSKPIETLPIMQPIKQIPSKKMTKYTLGKTNQTVGVLLKDNKTRKNIMTAQTNLRQKNIQQIKEYLKDHNLIKVGSNAPTDVLRKMFESAMLTGEITNSNKDILLHNFMKSD